MTNQQKYKQLHKILDDAAVYARTIGKMDFDIQCCAPEEGLPQAGEDIAVLSQQYFKLTHSKKFERLVTELAADHEGLTPVQQKVVEHLSDDWERSRTSMPSSTMRCLLRRAAPTPNGSRPRRKATSPFSATPLPRSSATRRRPSTCAMRKSDLLRHLSGRF